MSALCTCTEECLRLSALCTCTEGCLRLSGSARALALSDKERPWEASGWAGRRLCQELMELPPALRLPTHMRPLVESRAPGAGFLPLSASLAGLAGHWLSCTPVFFLDPPALHRARFGSSRWQPGALQADEGAGRPRQEQEQPGWLPVQPVPWPRKLFPAVRDLGGQDLKTRKQYSFKIPRKETMN